MKVAVWNYYTFSYVGSYEIAGDFSPSWDLLSPQNSVMKIAGDCVIEKMMIVACPVSHGRTFIGIVRDVKKNSAGITEVTAQEILSVLDVPIVSESFSAADHPLGPNDWLNDRADDYFNDASDQYQSISWLTFSLVNYGSGLPSPAWSSNETTTLLSALEEFTDAYGSVARFSFNGDNSSIVCEWTYSSKIPSYVFDLRTDAFSDVAFSDNTDTAVNKVIFKPMTDNYINTSTEYPFVLLSDGTISSNLSDPGRLTPVVSQIEFYSDEDLNGTSRDPSNLESSAAEILNVSKYSHEVKFKMRYHKKSSYLKAAFAALCCGTLVTLYGIPGNENTGIETKVTRIQVTGEDEIEVTCGYSRSQLTDKIKLRDRIDKGGKRIVYSVKGARLRKAFHYDNQDLEVLPNPFYAEVSVQMPKNAIVTSVYIELDDGTSYTQSPHDVRMLQRYSYQLSTVGGVTTVTIKTGDLTKESGYIGPTASYDNWLSLYVTVNYNQLSTSNV